MTGTLIPKNSQRTKFQNNGNPVLWSVSSPQENSLFFCCVFLSLFPRKIVPCVMTRSLSTESRKPKTEVWTTNDPTGRVTRDTRS